MTLRDHALDCEHGNTREHYPAWDGSGEKGDESCPGGREVTIDYTAAIDHLKYLRGLELTVGAMAEVIAAALQDPVDEWDKQPEGYEHMARRQNHE